MAITKILKLGSTGDQTQEWQRVLIKDGFDLSPWFDNSEFNEVTHNVTVSWQKERGLVGDGIVGPKTVAKIGTKSNILTNPLDEELNIKFIQAKNYTKSARNEIKWIVIHSMEAAEASTTSENIANWFASKDAPDASAHFCIDDDSIIQCVKEEQIAWHAKGANQFGIGLEHAGYARQTKDQWADLYSTRMLKRSAKLTAYLCKKWDIPIKYIDRDGLKHGEKGITVHNEVSKAFKESTHYDPGPNFPMDLYIQWIQQATDQGE